MRRLSLAVSAILVLALGVHAQEKAPKLPQFEFQPAEPKSDWKWDKDQRLDELLLQLQEKERALIEIDRRVAKLLGKKAGVKMDEAMAWRAMDRMDLKAGGPVRWDVFYGTNAENFFYHPVDPNTSYHTRTYLEQKDRGQDPRGESGPPSRQGLPVHQRPPQFDYIYNGYERRMAKAKELASQLANDLDSLKAEQRQYEKDVVLLWAKIAFKVQDRRKLSEKRELRWAALPRTRENAEASERAMAFGKAAHLLATALQLNDQRIETQSEETFGTASDLISKYRKAFADGLLRSEQLRKEAEDKDVKTSLAKFTLLSLDLEDTAKTLSEGYDGWRQGDQNDNEFVKYTGLRRVQNSLVQYAKIVLAMYELIEEMKNDWELDVKAEGPEFVPTWDMTHTPITTASTRRQDPPLAVSADDSRGANRGGSRANDVLAIDPKLVRSLFSTAKSSYEIRTGILRLEYDFGRGPQLKDWQLPNGAVPDPGEGGGIRIGPAQSLVHCGVFTEGTCSFSYAILNPRDRGPVVSAGRIISVTQREAAGQRLFQLCHEEVLFGTTDLTAFAVSLEVGSDHSRLMVNADAGVTVQRGPGGTFSFTLHGGNNGARVGKVTILGRLDPAWVTRSMR